MEENIQVNNNKKRKYMYIAGPLVLFIALIGITYAFFNYTRTGVANTIRVGKISFSSNQTDTIILTNVFPIASNEATGENENYDEVVITITGDTTYDEGIEYLITATDVLNTVNNKEIPLSIVVSASSGLGGEDTSYFNNRGGNSSIYKVLSRGTIKNNGEILVGYIAKGQTGVNGTVSIKAYIDEGKILISDTYPSGDVTHTESSGEASIEVVDYTNGTPDSMAERKTVLTTSEWNSLQNTSLSFKVKVEANEGLWVEEPLTGPEKVQRAIAAKVSAGTCTPTWTDPDDDTVYLSGDNNCIDFNYVWYSGKIWRITAIYPDGAMKLVTENNITSIAFNASEQVNFYTDSNITSYMYQWLNEDFYDTLYNANQLIDTSKQWNATMPSDTTISTKPLETNMVTANVGLLNNYEFYNSYRCIGSSTCTGSSYSTGYLNIEYYWWLLNPYNALYVWVVNNNGLGSNRNPTYAYGVRPSIYLKSGVEFTGEGTEYSPYKIVGDKDTGTANELVNTRMSGEYVKLQNGNNEQLFRIIGVEDNKTKIIAMDYADDKATKKFATNDGEENALWGSGATTDEGTWYTYLNATTDGYFDTLKNTYGDIFDSATYYFGTSRYNYKLSVCANTTSGNTKVCDKTNQYGIFNIGLPRYGEMFATQQSNGYYNSIDMWLMNRFSMPNVWRINSGGSSTSNSPSSALGARPTLHLKSTVKILSGSGTEQDPYVVGL